MTYEQTLTLIHAHGRFSGVPTLNRIRALLAALGDPQKQLRFVHIAGTNGKGSTAALLASACEQAGYRTGLFVSPYVMDFCERMRVNGTWISHEQLAELAQQVHEAECRLSLPEGESIGEFEFTTAVGMLYFVQQRCDLVILEAGLGGHFDATNAIDVPDCAVFTHIALDHMAVLGNTVEEIAADKAHIVKPGGTLVSYPQQPKGVPAILQQRCDSVGAAYLSAPMPEQIQADETGCRFVLDGQALSVPMLGEQQAYNAATAWQVCAVLRDKGWDRLDTKAVSAGFARAFLPARQEVLSREPFILIDGAHNADGVQALCRTLDTLFPQGGISLVLGMVSDKQFEDCVRMLTRRADNVYAVQPDSPRAVPSREIARLVREFSPYTNAFDCGDVRSALRHALRMAGEDDKIIVCGSFYIAGDAKQAAQELLGQN